MSWKSSEKLWHQQINLTLFSPSEKVNFKKLHTIVKQLYSNRDVKKNYNSSFNYHCLNLLSTFEWTEYEIVENEYEIYLYFKFKIKLKAQNTIILGHLCLLNILLDIKIISLRQCLSHSRESVEKNEILKNWSVQLKNEDRFNMMWNWYVQIPATQMNCKAMNQLI